MKSHFLNVRCLLFFPTEVQQVVLGRETVHSFRHKPKGGMEMRKREAHSLSLVSLHTCHQEAHMLRLSAGRGLPLSPPTQSPAILGVAKCLEEALLLPHSAGKDEASGLRQDTGGWSVAPDGLSPWPPASSQRRLVPERDLEPCPHRGVKHPTQLSHPNRPATSLYLQTEMV